MQEFSVPGEEQGFSLLWFQDEGSEGRQCHHMSLLPSLPSHISHFWKAPLISQLFIDWELNTAPSRETRVAFEPFCCQVFHGLSVKSLTCVLFSEKRECAVHGAPSALLKRVWIPAWHWVGACTHSTRQQGLLCSYRIHECMLNTARKGHSLSSAKPTAPLSTSTPYA